MIDTKEEKLKKGIELAKKVIELDRACDYSKLDEVELERIKGLVKMADMMFVDTGKYDPADDNVFIR